MLHHESHELSLSLSGPCGIRRLRSPRTVISEVCGVTAAVDFANIPSHMYHMVLCVLPGDFHPGTGYILGLAQYYVNCVLLTQVFCTEKPAAQKGQGIQASKCICQAVDDSQ